MFTTFSSSLTVNLIVGKTYKVQFAGETVLAKFVKFERHDVIMHEGKGRRVRLGSTQLTWERV